MVREMIKKLLLHPPFRERGKSLWQAGVRGISWELWSESSTMYNVQSLDGMNLILLIFGLSLGSMFLYGLQLQSFFFFFVIVCLVLSCLIEGLSFR